MVTRWREEWLPGNVQRVRVKATFNMTDRQKQLNGYSGCGRGAQENVRRITETFTAEKQERNDQDE